MFLLLLYLQVCSLSIKSLENCCCSSTTILEISPFINYPAKKKSLSSRRRYSLWNLVFACSWRRNIKTFYIYPTSPIFIPNCLIHKSYLDSVNLVLSFISIFTQETARFQSPDHHNSKPDRTLWCNLNWVDVRQESISRSNDWSEILFYFQTNMVSEILLKLNVLNISNYFIWISIAMPLEIEKLKRQTQKKRVVNLWWKDEQSWGHEPDHLVPWWWRWWLKMFVYCLN